MFLNINHKFLQLFIPVVPREVEQNRFFFVVFLLIFFIDVSCGHDFLLTQRTRLSKPFRYLEHARNVHRKFSRGFWKKVSAQIMSFCQNIPTPFWALFLPHCFSWNVFQRPPDNFLFTLRTFSRYLQSPTNRNICVSNKIVTTWHTNQIIYQEKWNKQRFWKK